MPADEPTDPTPPSYEVKLNVVDAQIRQLESEFSIFEALRDDMEDIYTAPTPVDLDKLEQFTNLMVRFMQESTRIAIEKNALHQRLLAIAADPAGETPQFTKRVGDLSGRLVILMDRIEAMRMHAMSLMPRREP